MKINLKATGCEVMDSIHLATDRDISSLFGNRVMNLRVPKSAQNFSSSRRNISFSKRTLLHGVS
jgi:hypothetical protein